MKCLNCGTTIRIVPSSRDSAKLQWPSVIVHDGDTFSAGTRFPRCLKAAPDAVIVWQEEPCHECNINATNATRQPD